MNSPPGIFIASSTEGNAASNAIESELRVLAGEKVIIRHWTKQFQLSQVYIESLEQSVKSCDFGVLNFDDNHHSSEKMVRGHGRFFDINEARIKESSVRAVTLKRETDLAIINAMINGSEKRKVAIAQRISKNW